MFTDASAIADSEEPAQDLLHKLASDMCKLGNRGLHACDTHLDGYPVDPIGKVDVIVSTTQKPLSGQVRNGGQLYPSMRVQGSSAGSSHCINALAAVLASTLHVSRGLG